MDQFFILLKNTLFKKSNCFGLISTIVLSLINFLFKKYARIDDIIYLKVYIVLISVTLFFPINSFFNYIINEKEKGFASKNIFSSRKISYAKAGKYLFLCICLIVVPVYMIIMGTIQTLNKIKLDDSQCEKNLKRTGIIIANFNDTNKEVDGFSSTLYGRLNSDLQKFHRYNVKLSNTYISESDSDYLGKIKTIFQQNCSGSGLVIFGSRKDEKYFNCRIYSYNYINYKLNGFVKAKDTTIIYIQNPFGIKSPDYMNFYIEYEANTISDFTHGVIYNHEGSYELSSQLISKALNENNNPANNQFISICHLFIGNNLFAQGFIEQAKSEYSRGVSFYQNNEYLHYNIAEVYRRENDIPNAFKEYNIAHDLNNDFRNPLQILNQTENKHFLGVLPSLKIKANSKKGRDTLKLDTVEKVNAPADWEEHCYTIYENKKYGVINNKNDTIISCKYDTIQSFRYKNADCYIVKIKNTYGAIIHNHTNYGYTLLLIKLEYPTLLRITDQVTYCVDNH